jgi:hypothetical protein
MRLRKSTWYFGINVCINQVYFLCEHDSALYTHIYICVYLYFFLYTTENWCCYFTTVETTVCQPTNSKKELTTKQEDDIQRYPTGCFLYHSNSFSCFAFSKLGFALYSFVGKYTLSVNCSPVSDLFLLCSWCRLSLVCAPKKNEWCCCCCFEISWPPLVSFSVGLPLWSPCFCCWFCVSLPLPGFAICLVCSFVLYFCFFSFPLRV